MANYQDLRVLVQSYLSPSDVQLIDEAHEVAVVAHEGQFRHSGEPYVHHPVEVGYILAQYGLDKEIICACLLHDVLEDTEWTFEDLAERFGNTIARLVDGVSKLRQISFPSRAHEQAENLWKMMLAIAQDLRVIIIKLADRLHNMRTLGSLRKSKQHRKALETLEIYAPMAARIGMYEFKKEFEALGFSAIYPWRSEVLSYAIDRAVGLQKENIDQVMAHIAQNVQAQCRIEQRSAYEVYREMKHDRVRFNDLKDFAIVEVVCSSVEQCYHTLGVIHQRYRPIMHRFRDYIALPKGNGYQSLHTTIMLSPQSRLNIHIRSKQMKTIAQRGVATDNQEQYQRAQRWIVAMIQARHEHSSSIEFAAHFKEDLHRDDVYVFDENGEILGLPQGSTPLDFAFITQPQKAICCVKAFINGKETPFSRVLKNGQTISLQHSDHPTVSANWLLFAGSAKVRAHIRQALREIQQKEAIVLGEKIFSQALHSLSCSMQQLQKNLGSAYWEALGYSSSAMLFLAIGLGKVDIIARIRSLSHQSAGSAPVVLQVILPGHSCSLMTPSACCYPSPGDKVRVIPAMQDGWEVHREDCPLLNNKMNVTSFTMSWGVEQAISVADLEMVVLHQPGALAQIIQVIAQQHSNIQSVYTDPVMDRFEQKIRIRLAVKDREHLEKILEGLRKLEVVRRVSRVG